MFTKYCDDCGYKCKTEEERDMWCKLHKLPNDNPCKTCDNIYGCNGCNEASDEQMLAFEDAMCDISRVIFGECCKSCSMSCDEWDAIYCCTLCHEEGYEHCDTCDPMDI